jgi:hemerythrin
MKDRTAPPALTARDSNAPKSASDSSMAWSDARLLGFTPMDDVHEEFYSIALRLVVCTDDTAAAAMAAFEEHAISHFNQEDEWMRSTDFPPRDCHMDEHAAALRTVAQLREALASGQANAEVIRDFGMYLFEWFPGHADYLDSALAAWMTKRSMGGKPVVLRRNV